MINNNMKTYREILESTTTKAFMDYNQKCEVNLIVDILENIEKYLGRVLNENEVSMFTEILLEEEEKSEKQEPAFKRGKYKIEIMTPQGKVVRTASSQKGILDVIHSAKTYRILDSNNRDITNKVKSFVREREKQQMLRKKLKKKGKLKEEFEVLSEGPKVNLKGFGSWLKGLFKGTPHSPQTPHNVPHSPKGPHGPEGPHNPEVPHGPKGPKGPHGPKGPTGSKLKGAAKGAAKAATTGAAIKFSEYLLGGSGDGDEGTDMFDPDDFTTPSTTQSGSTTPFNGISTDPYYGAGGAYEQGKQTGALGTIYYA